MTESARVRFAPSPTGYLHLGSARAALFNWLAARHMGGKFLLRIEDTDLDRSKPELIEIIYRGLEWLGLDWDEDPVLQSSRNEAHRAAVDALIESGDAYWSSPVAPEERENFGGHSYDPADRDRNLGPGDGRAVRFRVPDTGSTGWSDLIRGEISVDHANIEDFVIRRADGSPTFFLANTSDDAFMGITHVIRGEDLINVTPKYLLLRAAMGIAGPIPQFAHMPLIVNEQRKKLSKRRDDVSLMDYRDRGFLPEAMVNYLSLLGWGPTDGQEVRFDPLSTSDGFPTMFRIEDVSSSPAFFDTKKLLFVNGEHIRALSAEEFAKRVEPFIDAAPWAERFRGDPENRARLQRMLPEVQTRVETLAEVPGYVDFIFLADPEIDEKSWKKAMVADAHGWLDAVIDAAGTWEWDAESLHESFMALAESMDANRRKFQAPVRVAVTGRSVGPPLFESMAVLGQEEVLRRLRSARDRVASVAGDRVQDDN
ncbi:MAG: glutamate--tRNA ligase [Microthrixaceae bacterium]